MQSDRITVPKDLLNLKRSADLDSVSMSTLARRGTSILQKLVSSAQAVAIKIQGHGSMVTLSQRQYDEMVTLIHQLKAKTEDDGFTEAMSQRFDDLVERMNLPGASEASDAALFGNSDKLNKTYRPGATETKD
jgi:PHD/YefM family antitoxin component YafN of YafNO toxin-antitoxin module